MAASRIVNAKGGSRVCSLLSLVPYPKRAHFLFLTLMAKYQVPRRLKLLSKAVAIASIMSHQDPVWHSSQLLILRQNQGSCAKHCRIRRSDSCLILRSECLK
jgi:hypothetical protein